MTTMTPVPSSPSSPRSPGSPPRSRLSTAGSAIGLLRERAWLGALLGVIVISIVFVFLGRWQYHRHEARTARNNLVKTNYGAPPVALGALLPAISRSPGGQLPGGLQWRPVQVTGSYLTEHTVLLRNRPQPSQIDGDDGIGNQNSQNGYEEVVPFRTSAGPILLIDRGWIPAGRTSAAPDSIPMPAAGDVTVIARLRPSEPGSSRKAPPGQANRLDVSRLAEPLGTGDAAKAVPAYGQLASETPSVANTPTPLGKPDPGLGINFAYAVQWVAFAIAAYVMLAVAMVREIRRRDLSPTQGRPRYGLAR